MKLLRLIRKQITSYFKSPLFWAIVFILLKLGYPSQKDEPISCRGLKAARSKRRGSIIIRVDGECEGQRGLQWIAALIANFMQTDGDGVTGSKEEWIIKKPGVDGQNADRIIVGHGAGLRTFIEIHADFARQTLLRPGKHFESERTRLRLAR